MLFFFHFCSVNMFSKKKKKNREKKKLYKLLNTSIPHVIKLIFFDAEKMRFFFLSCLKISQFVLPLVNRVQEDT